MGTTHAMNMEVIGENVTVETYQGLSCYGEDADQLYVFGLCAQGCSDCGTNYSASQIGLSDCTVQNSNSYQFSCVNGSAVLNYYADTECQVCCRPQVSTALCLPCFLFLIHDTTAGSIDRDRRGQLR